MDTPAPVIEFITVSRDPQRLERLKRSISLAMGTALPYRMTVIDGNRHDLFTGYNSGARQTQADILAFVHDDVQFMGNALVFGGPLKWLNDPGTAFVGVTGSNILDADGTIWSGNRTQQQIFDNCRGLVYHPAKNEFGIRSFSWPTRIANFGQVLTVDGVLLMCHRRTFNQLNGFDEARFKGFHFYDLDITYRAALAGLRNCVAPIPLLHESIGNYGHAWETNRQIFVEKFKGLLPAALTLKPPAPTPQSSNATDQRQP